MTTEKLEAILNKTLGEITIIKSNWFIWKGLREEMREGAKYEKLLEYSPCFWTITLDNLLSKTLLGTAKLYDEDKECMGLQKIINTCEQNQKLFPKNRTVKCKDGYTGEELSYIEQIDISECVRNARQKYQTVQNFRMQLIVLRDKHLAHTDKKIAVDAEELYHEVSLKGESLEKLIETAANITNSFLANLSGTVVHTEFHNADDYKTLLRYAKEGKEAYLQRIKSKMNNKG